jgi:ABC-type oligopeptide transport system ATPase subunit
MSDKFFKKQVFKDNSKNKYSSNLIKKKPSKDDEKEDKEVFNIKKIDEVKYLLQQSANS